MARTLGKVADVPDGSVVAFEVGGKRVAVANVDGRLFAFDDACTHRGCSLADGSLKGAAVTCPCHGSVFKVKDGSVMNGPAPKPLLTYDVEVVADDISISLDAIATPSGEKPAIATDASSTPVPPARAVAGDSSASASDRERTRSALASVPLFADLDEASIDGLVAFTFHKEFAAGELIVEEGRTGNGLYVVLSGSVEVVQGVGGHPKRLRVLGPGEPFGEIALLGDWKRTASVRAIDHVDCLGMDRWAFLAHLKTEPALAIRMLQMVAARLAKADADADAAGEFVVREALPQDSEHLP